MPARPAHAPDRRLQLTSRDRRLLEFLAEHRLVLAGHVRVLLGVSRTAADARLRALAHAGYLSRVPVLHRQPWCIQITRTGLAAIGSQLPAPRLNLHSYHHDVGSGWLWLAAGSGTFGQMREVVGERRMRSHDASPRHGSDPFGVRLGGIGADGRDRRHYPDLLLIRPGGGRVAVELELSSKGPARTQRILAGYGADPQVAGVLYLVENRAIGRSVERCARKLGISDLVKVQMVRCTGAPAGGERGRIATRAHGVRAMER
ncbi:MAG: hypothetical protein M3076_06420 [Actinomycetota bacterium]|nr:hypothetical protein [Actinomycetota bacterium]